MRTYDEIHTDINAAISIYDIEVLRLLAQEMNALGTPDAVAMASNALGSVAKFAGDYRTASEHYNNALALFEELGDRTGMCSVTGNIGLIHKMTGEYPAALEHFKRAQVISEELGDLNGVATAFGNIGSVYRQTGDYPAALEHLRSALTLHEELGNRSGIAGATSNIGTVYDRTGDYASALQYYHRALALCEEIGHRHFAANVLANIGIVYNSTGDYRSALEHLHRALTFYEELGDSSGIANATGSIGTTHYNAGDFTKALVHFRSALANHVELGEQSGVALDRVNIMGALLANGSHDEAQALLQVIDATQIDEPGVRIINELHRATLIERSGNLERAAAILQKALVESHEHGRRAEAAEIHKALRDLAQKRNDFAEYIEHNNEYTRITEEINGKDTATKIAMQAKQREIDAREREHQKHLAVLHSTLPKEVATRVARGEVVNDHYENATVIFLDIVGFTELSSSLSSQDVIALLDDVFTHCDEICATHGVTKIKTIGDSYMCVSFDNVMNAAQCALEMRTIEHRIKNTGSTPSFLRYRIGMHCGPVTAGVIGTQRMQYDVWGDTVNVASRMESTSQPGRIHVSEALANALNEALNEAHIVPRGEIEVKGKGMMKTYWLE